MANAVSSYCKTIEHLNSTNSRLRGQINILEELICALKSQMETRVISNTNTNRSGNGNENSNNNGNSNGYHSRNGNGNGNGNFNHNRNGNVNGNGNVNRNRNGKSTRGSRGQTIQLPDTSNTTVGAYYWTHNKTGNELHTSGVCRYPAIVHNMNSTLENPQDGSTFGTE